MGFKKMSSLIRVAVSLGVISLACIIPISAEDGLSDILSDNQNLLFEYDFRSNIAQSDKLQRSWINPIMLRYSRDYSEQFGPKVIKTNSFTVSIDQPSSDQAGSIMQSSMHKHSEVLMRHRLL